MRGRRRRAGRCRPHPRGPSVRRSSPFASTYAAVGERDGALRALLDEQDGEAAVADLRPARRRRRRRSSARARATARRAAARRARRRARARSRAAAAGRPRARPPGASGTRARPGRARRRSARAPSPLVRARRPARPSRRFSSTVSSAKMRRPSGTSATPRRAMSSGRRPTSDVPSSRTSPPVTGAAPMIACSVDDLPAPFGPIRPTISPGLHLEREAAHGLRPRRSGPRGSRRRARSLGRPRRCTALSPR